MKQTFQELVVASLLLVAMASNLHSFLLLVANIAKHKVREICEIPIDFKTGQAWACQSEGEPVAGSELLCVPHHGHLH